MNSKWKKFVTWYMATRNAATDVHQARMALNTEYTLDEWLKQQDSTRKDCISCAGAMLPMTGRPLGEEWRYYRHCDFYKENCFCGIDAGECESRDKNLKYANAFERWELARKHRNDSFKALFHLKRK